MIDNRKDNIDIMASDNLTNETSLPSAEPMQTMIEQRQSLFPVNMTFLSNEHNLDLMKPDADLIDENRPFSGFAMAGRWLKEAFDVRNYWEASQRLGEEVAQYQWEINESGENFDKLGFTKEVAKSGIRHLSSDGLKTMGNLLKMTGENFKQTRGVPEVVQKLRVGAGEGIVRLGNAFNHLAEKAAEADIWAPDYDNTDLSPRMVQFADSIGAGASQVLSMGLVSRFIGPKATYALFTVGGAGEMFDEALVKTGDVQKANELALTNAGVTYAIDRWFNPLPKTIAKNARLTAGEIAKETLGAPLREAGSEVLQQMLAENLVRQAGIDDTQDLFEGLIESAVGAMAGSSVITGAQGSYYAASQTYNAARQRILQKGVEPAALEMAEQGMLQVLREHPEAFQKVLDTNFKLNILAFENEAKKAQTLQERLRADEAAKGFPKVYDTLYNRAFEAFNDETKAKTAASVLSAGVMTLYNHTPDLSVKQIAEQFLPEFKQMSYADFMRQTSPDAAVSYMFGGQKAKNADLAKMSDALTALDAKIDAREVWRKTGWHLGSDGKMRFEISDDKAKLKLWKPSDLDLYTEKLFSTEINELNEIKAKTADELKSSSGGIYAGYFKEFWDFLDDKVRTDLTLSEAINDTDYARDYYQVLDEADLIKREAETAYIKNLWEDYQAHNRDFNEEEYNTVRGILENRRYNRFLKEVVHARYGMEDSLADLANALNDDFTKRDDFQARFAEIMNEGKARMDSRKQAITDLGLDERADLYQDIKLDTGYKTYALYSGDLSGDIADMNFRPQGYRQAFAPLSFGEQFLTQDKFSHLSATEKEVLSEFLNKVEFLYRIDGRVTRLQNDFANELKKNRAEDLQNFKNGVITPAQQMRLQQRLLLAGGTAMRLYDLLDHKALFQNYPELQDVQVEFKDLKDNVPYHFYQDKAKGYVLEVDAKALNYTGLKETLLKGAAFAVQDIEGFDYSLSDKERRNFMDRQVFLAQQKLSGDIIGKVEDFLARFPVANSVDDVVTMQNLPTSLAGIAESRAKDLGDKYVQNGYYAEVDFKRLEKMVEDYFANASTDDEVKLLNLARAHIQQIKNDYTAEVISVARAWGGYDAAWLPWGGLTSQGAIDERALIRRMDYTDEQRRLNPYWRDYQPEEMLTDDEFSLQKQLNQRQYKKVISEIAQGAYEYGTKTIDLFQNADAETIVHESFHYFWDMLQAPAVRNNVYAVEFNEAMDELRQEFISRYRVEAHDGKFYAFERATGAISPEMPIGYPSAQAAADAGIEELFVGSFLAKMAKKSTPYASLNRAMNFYQDWLKSMTNKLGISSKLSGDDGRKILKFLKSAKKHENGKIDKGDLIWEEMRYDEIR